MIRDWWAMFSIVCMSLGGGAVAYYVVTGAVDPGASGDPSGRPSGGPNAGR